MHKKSPAEIETGPCVWGRCASQTLAVGRKGAGRRGDWALGGGVKKEQWGGDWEKVGLGVGTYPF